MIEEYDDKMIRCPRIGGDVNFRFCRFENNMIPCRWITGCWNMRMDIDTFLKDHYSEEELNKIFIPPKPKMQSLIEMVEKTKKRGKEGI